jgi:hypothetical protein
MIFLMVTALQAAGQEFRSEARGRARGIGTLFCKDRQSLPARASQSMAV